MTKESLKRGNEIQKEIKELEEKLYNLLPKKDQHKESVTSIYSSGETVKTKIRYKSTLEEYGHFQTLEQEVNLKIPRELLRHIYTLNINEIRGKINHFETEFNNLK